MLSYFTHSNYLHDEIQASDYFPYQNSPSSLWVWGDLATHKTLLRFCATPARRRRACAFQVSTHSAPHCAPMPTQKIKTDIRRLSFLLWAWGDLNSQSLRHTLLKRTCIPIPPHARLEHCSRKTLLKQRGAPIGAPLVLMNIF